MKEIIIVDRPTEYYLMLMFSTIEEKIKLVCFADKIDYKNKSRKLALKAERLGYKLENVDFKEKYETHNGKVLTEIVVFELKMTDFLKKRNKDLDKNPETKLIEKTRYHEFGKMIFIKRYILARLSKESISTRERPREDKNEIIERIIEERDKLREKNG